MGKISFKNTNNPAIDMSAVINFPSAVDWLVSSTKSIEATGESRRPDSTRW